MKPEKRSGALIAIGAFFVILFAGMLVYTSWYAWHNRKTMMANSYNRRQNLYAKTVKRGSIYASDKTLLAFTETDADERQVRVYPYGEAFAHAVGYQARDKSGVEAYANYDLLHTGLSLTEKMRFAGEGTLFPGGDVVTTLDAPLQQAVFEALGEYKGAVIVTNPKTGAILAMVSYPSFDPALVEEQWDAYTKDSEEGRLVNRVTQGTYPAGSTFKIVTTLAYMRSNPSGYADYAYQCYGSFSSAGRTVHCYDGIAHGAIDLKQSFALSCNSSFVNLGLSANRDVFAKTLSGLYFNDALPYDMVYNRSVATDPRTTPAEEIMQLSIGQGDMLMSPLHMNMITSAIANGGVLAVPHLIDCVTDHDGTKVRTSHRNRNVPLMTGEEASVITQMMRAAVTDGTAIVLADRPYRACGKTGSAEHEEKNDEDNTHAWFTGFAPAEDPEVCLTLILEDAGSSGSYAVPLARQVFDAYFGY